MRNPIIVALDLADAETALRRVDQLIPVVDTFKVGKELFVHAGPEVVRQILQRGGRVFLDLKFHDIPNTVRRAVASAVRLGVHMMTLHVSGGKAMLEAAVESARQTAAELQWPPPLLLGVTVLTSLDQSDLSSLGIEGTVGRQVERLARIGLGAGLGGLVCSPLELAFLRGFVPADCQLVTPGVRAPDSAADDQKRTMTAAEALSAGADWLVVGRPICAAPDPRRAAQDLLSTLHSKA
jgi:orotidine-5'-phosphate decarboxylase